MALNWLVTASTCRQAATRRIGERTLSEAGLQQARHASSKRGGSSSRYLQRQRNDVFVKQRSKGAPTGTRSGSRPRENGDDSFAEASLGEGGYVARSAFKLLQLDDRYRFLRPGRVIVDLGAAPGGWSQAIVERLARSSASAKLGSEHNLSAPQRIFALDILPMAPIDGVCFLQGDFLNPVIQDRLRMLVRGNLEGHSSTVPADSHVGCEFVDIVVSDMMANTTGNPIADTEASLELCRAAFMFASRTLKALPAVNGAAKPKLPASSSSMLVMKYFMSHEADLFRKQVLEKSFHFVKSEKMEASRKESREQFWVCIGFRGAAFVPEMSALI
ncbi:23S ribosomal RNA methyltransferase [Testicularia cyperi]|uniref:rRNA methyltransferase 2, mitochondrial n=1 Tax=Testicularia cyperi TaxID=1882483 RepID=A0A317XXU7_9BASI|nr:23S ribosomal RNA methyltransferase [Testicularia cyperi]